MASLPADSVVLKTWSCTCSSYTRALMLMMMMMMMLLLRSFSVLLSFPRTRCAYSRMLPTPKRYSIASNVRIYRIGSAPMLLLLVIMMIMA